MNTSSFLVAKKGPTPGTFFHTIVSGDRSEALRMHRQLQETALHADVYAISSPEMAAALQNGFRLVSPRDHLEITRAMTHIPTAPSFAPPRLRREAFEHLANEAFMAYDFGENYAIRSQAAWADLEADNNHFRSELVLFADAAGTPTGTLQPAQYRLRFHVEASASGEIDAYCLDANGHNVGWLPCAGLDFDLDEVEVQASSPRPQ
jgi:hypothetical protein